MGWHKREEAHRLTCAAAALIGCIMIGALGACNRNPYLASAPPGANAPFGGSTNSSWGNPAMATQYAELERRVQSLDDINRQLTTQLAQSQQQVQLYRERSDLLQRQLQDVAGQLAQNRIVQNPTPQQLRGSPGAAPSRGNARLVANNTLGRQAESIRELGFDVLVEGDVIRVSIPADTLFQPGTAQLSGNASAVLDRAAAAISRNFPRQRIAVEGHSDDRELFGGSFSSLHQLTSAQSIAVLEQFVRRNGLPQSQLFSLAHGGNHPRSDNQTPGGRALNRRIDLVIYPDTF